eukprot:NODE_28_length_38599_cov_0.791792.p9 type:complete len:392 gc:universal NODE_28_length_38599_cov_0.791792:21740-22915(+)
MQSIREDFIDLASIKSGKPELQECIKIFNGVTVRYNKKDYLILRCKLDGNIKITNIKLISPDKVATLNITETDAFKNWDGGKSYYKQFYGAEDPRIMQFQNEIYIYYTMNNPNPRKPVRSLGYMKLKDAISGSDIANFLTPSIFGQDPGEIEKNWLFISNETDILVLYNLKPYILADIRDNQLVAQIQRDYDCVRNFDRVHFSSNAIEIDNNGKEEFMFVFNVREYSNPTNYFPYVGFLEANAPFQLLRITNHPLKFISDAKKWSYVQGLTVKSQRQFNAFLNDTILFTGGVDDEKVFMGEAKLKDLMSMETKLCTFPSNEWNYFKPAQTLVCPIINDTLEHGNDSRHRRHFGYQFLVAVIVIFVFLIGILFKKSRQGRSKIVNSAKYHSI